MSKLKQYQLMIETITPVFIGSGVSITKKDYIYDEAKGEVFIPELTKLIHFFGDNAAMKQKYLAFLNSRDPKDNSLFRFLQSQGISDFSRFGGYHYKVKIEANTPIEIRSFIKDAYGGLPYIPGSSIKGALRTCLLAYLTNDKAKSKYKAALLNRQNFEERNQKRLLSEATNALENDVFATLDYGEKANAQTRDILKGLRISDSPVIDIDQLTLCRKVDIHIDGFEKPLNVLRECLKPHTLIKVNMTIDPSQFSYPISTIMEAIASFYDSYCNYFGLAFKDFQDYGNNVFYLGGGAGYASKTVVHKMFDFEKALDTVSQIMNKTTPFNHKHRDDKKKRVSPHTLKCTYYEGKLLEFGVCALDIQEVK